MLYVESRKSFKVRREKNEIICRVPSNYTRQTYFFAECPPLPSVFGAFAECICLPSVFTNGHSTNILTDDTRTDECPLVEVGERHYVAVRWRWHILLAGQQPLLGRGPHAKKTATDEALHALEGDVRMAPQIH